MKSTASRRAVLAAASLSGVLALTPVIAADAAAPGAVYRIAGADRYAASANISLASFNPGVDTAYVASGEVFTDALSGAPVAGKNKGPVLLTKAESLPSVIEEELTRLKPQHIVIFGGKNSVSNPVANKLKKLSGDGTITRIAAPTRYSTSAKISSLNYDAGPDTTFIASGEVFPDALSGAPVAGKTPGPLLLVESDKVHGVVKKELERLQSKEIVVLGGETTITPETADFLTRYTTGSVTRLAGPDRFSTSAEISKANYAPGVENVYVSSGRVFADALSGAPVAGMKGSPVLLVDTDAIPASIDAELKRLKPTNIIILGGTASVTEKVENQLKTYLG